jgi:hypothetical protein
MITLDSNPSPNMTNPSRITSFTLVVHACFTCLACYFFLVCVSCLSTLGRVNRRRGENPTESRRREQGTHESEKGILDSERRQVLTPTSPFPSIYYATSIPLPFLLYINLPLLNHSLFHRSSTTIFHCSHYTPPLQP